MPIPIHIGRASELSGNDRLLYRFFEIVPGFLSWTTIFLSLILSFFIPTWVAVFIIAFDFYWFLKTIYLSIHLRQNWRRLRENIARDWQKELRDFNYSHLYHLVILPFCNESRDVVEKTIRTLTEVKYDLKKFIIVLATEERAGKPAQDLAESIKRSYADKFGFFHITKHPSDIKGELLGKGANIAFSADRVREEVIDREGIPYENIIVSAFDIDTIPYPQYFLVINWYFLNSPDPFRTSYQPVPLFNNNIWDAPAISRVVASSGTFWQMVQQERPEKLATFSSHSVSFKTLHDIGYWQRNMVSEDSRIFWNAFVAYSGNYVVTPVAYPVSMDANLAPSFWQTMKNVYKQQRRWAWGVENVPYILFSFFKDKNISLNKKIRTSFVQLEGFWSLATNPLLIFILGWAPIAFGGDAFNSSIISYNLPYVTRNIMILAMVGLIFSAVISFSFLPPRPLHKSRANFFIMAVQWILVPFTIVVFGAIPGLDAQTRLLLGKYMGFWITPKHRKPSQN